MALTQDSLEIARHGLFTGYNPLVLLSIVLQAFTGLVRRRIAVCVCRSSLYSSVLVVLSFSVGCLNSILFFSSCCLQAVALVVKYADNLYKGFGHAFSLVICSCVSSVLFEDTAVNETFLTGSFLVIASSAAFSTVAQPGNKEESVACLSISYPIVLLASLCLNVCAISSVCVVCAPVW